MTRMTAPMLSTRMMETYSLPSLAYVMKDFTDMPCTVVHICLSRLNNVRRVRKRNQALDFGWRMTNDQMRFGARER